MMVVSRQQPISLLLIAMKLSLEENKKKKNVKEVPLKLPESVIRFFNFIRGVVNYYSIDLIVCCGN